jgi:hypothetical protein
MERPVDDPVPVFGPIAAHDEVVAPRAPVAVPRAAPVRSESAEGAVGATGWPWAAAALVFVASFEAAAIVSLWPAAQRLEAVVDENVTLRTQLAEMASEATSLESLMFDLGTQDATLRAYVGPKGSQGGPELDALAAEGEVAMDDHDAEDFAPASDFAEALRLRIADLQDRYQRGQPEVDKLMAELQGLRGIAGALPQSWPAPGELTSGFGWRSDPFRGSARFHAGVDVAAPTGTPIYAAASGRVLRAEWSSGYGNLVEIDHGFGITTRYGHNSAFVVATGDTVRAGQLIAKMGSTGRSTGPHCHFELRIDGTAHDPMKYLQRLPRP